MLTEKELQECDAIYLAARAAKRWALTWTEYLLFLEDRLITELGT